MDLHPRNLSDPPRRAAVFRPSRGFPAVTCVVHAKDLAASCSRRQQVKPLHRRTIEVDIRQAIFQLFRLLKSVKC